ncbi:MAG: NAD(P)H-hydrate dehydratase [Bacteroidetes bacterium]|nr:NAD(P)H-hydrate dehydratase [Bacteroidota bacterium]
MYPLLSNLQVAKLIKPRLADSHKGTYGHSLIIAGAGGKMGAAVIAAKACMRTGTGLLTVVIPYSERAILQSALPEAMIVSNKATIDFNKFSAIGIGPAVGITKHSLLLLYKILNKANLPLLIDADAISLLAKNKQLWKKIPAGSVLTPHVAEFDRLFGQHDTAKERMQKAVALSKKYPWVIVLKNFETLIAFNGEAVVSTAGNAGLAKGGSGDMLSGMITALLAQGYAAFNAAKIGVQLHGIAADIALAHQSMESLLATDVIEEIGGAFKKVIKRL